MPLKAKSQTPQACKTKPYNDLQFQHVSKLADQHLPSLATTTGIKYGKKWPMSSVAGKFLSLQRKMSTIIQEGYRQRDTKSDLTTIITYMHMCWFTWHVQTQCTPDYPDLDYPAPQLSGFETRPKRGGVLTKVLNVANLSC